MLCDIFVSLQKHKTCKKWRSAYEEYDAGAEKNEFTNGKHIKKVIKEVSQRLNQTFNFGKNFFNS